MTGNNAPCIIYDANIIYDAIVIYNAIIIHGAICRHIMKQTYIQVYVLVKKNTV